MAVSIFFKQLKRLIKFAATLLLTYSWLAQAVAQSDGGQVLNTLSGNVKIVSLEGEELGYRANVVILLDGVGDETAPESASKKKPVISQAGRRFSPHVLAVTKGTAVEFPNDDVTYHNVFSLSRPKPFDLGIYAQGTSKTVEFDKPGLVKIYCNIHPDMVSNILVLNNHYFAVSDEEGDFVIESVPDGSYTLRVWHEFSEVSQETVNIVGAKNHTFSFVVRENKKLRRHKNKFGKTYKSKY